ncbi:OmpA family protein [Neobacillus thermocopriae]|uniref:OmpA family protein n=1 Tax=Neobacillus thermocopriae TaxID=1215031 RepID=UPI002E1CF0C3|nr:OmpA family protein [Neobacillus thermocopriae]MED3713771.1 OmpA family protein [Neobacillus thermocopriae]
MRKKRRRFDDEHEEHINESWLIPYADILTLLLALFIVLFASSIIDAEKFRSIMESFKSELTGTKINTTNLTVEPPSDKKQVDEESEEARKEQAELDELLSKLEKFVTDNHLQAVITLQDSKRGVEIALKEVILFDQGKADLKESSYPTLDVLVNLAKTVSNPISIEGHTDNVPIKNSKYPSNWELSSARAVSVLHYFASKGIAQDRMQFVGYGEFKPLYPNDTEEHKQSNRRVNIVILRVNKSS